MEKKKLREYLLEVKDQIKEEPENFLMSDWSQATSCGTACCIGGWLEVISQKEIRVQLGSVTNNMPDLPWSSSDDRDSNLFYVDKWYSFLEEETIKYIEDIIQTSIYDDWVETFDGLSSKKRKKNCVQSY